MSEFFPILTSQLIVFMHMIFFVTLVKREGVAKVRCTLDHQVGAILPDAAVPDYSKDLCMQGLTLIDDFRLFALEHDPSRVVGLDVIDEVVELPYRTFELPGTVLFFLGAVF